MHYGSANKLGKRIFTFVRTVFSFTLGINLQHGGVILVLTSTTTAPHFTGIPML